LHLRGEVAVAVAVVEALARMVAVVEGGVVSADRILDLMTGMKVLLLLLLLLLLPWFLHAFLFPNDPLLCLPPRLPSRLSPPFPGPPARTAASP